ncbi:MAG: hypothetical protein HZB59_07015 [Ignavibacteriales bacterium]|nr:hypothetical protein [Ignavibacteriales bacterium]
MLNKNAVRYFLLVPSFILIILLLSFLIIDDSISARTKTEQVQLTGYENHSIGLYDASRLIKNYRESVPTGSVLGEYFGGNAIQEVLKQEGCIGIRIYFAKKDDGNPALVIVGVDKAGNDMSDNTILEYGFPCPPLCSSDNALTK